MGRRSVCVSTCRRSVSFCRRSVSFCRGGVSFCRGGGKKKKSAQGTHGSRADPTYIDFVVPRNKNGSVCIAVHRVGHTDTGCAHSACKHWPKKNAGLVAMCYSGVAVWCVIPDMERRLSWHCAQAPDCMVLETMPATDDIISSYWLRSYTFFRTYPSSLPVFFALIPHFSSFCLHSFAIHPLLHSPSMTYPLPILSLFITHPFPLPFLIYSLSILYPFLIHTISIPQPAGIQRNALTVFSQKKCRKA